VKPISDVALGAVEAARPRDRVDVEIRPLTTVAEFARCVDLQRAIWRWSEIDLMPTRLFVLMQHVGGLVLGAHDGDDLVGFVNCVPGVHERRAYWHSHMMGVVPAKQNRGIGTALKVAQRAHALRAGVGWIQWVFDPLVAKNAYLNVAKLGAIVRRYSANHYGASSSPLHAGLESDRLIAEWPLDTTAIRVGRETRTIVVPADIQSLKHVDMEAVRALQLSVRRQFLQLFADGFVVVDCYRGVDHSLYVLRRRL
jgi:predicted GNAT superfamily acetyltransferase